MSRAPLARTSIRDALDSALADAGVNLAAEYRSGRYLPVDAEEALGHFMTPTATKVAAMTIADETPRSAACADVMAMRRSIPVAAAAVPTSATATAGMERRRS